MLKLSEYDGRYVRIEDVDGSVFSGRAEYASSEFLECEYGGNEDGMFIEDVLIRRSRIRTVEETEVHGTAELWTENLILRRYRTEDAEALYEKLGTDPDMARYSGWNPYATQGLAQETVRRFMASYEEAHAYSWVIDVDGLVVGTIGAYDYAEDQIEVGFSVARTWRGRGFATEALRKVLKYLTENEGISCVTAWCAGENAASRSVMEKAGMHRVRTEKDGLRVGDRVYDRQIYEYRPAGRGPQA